MRLLISRKCLPSRVGNSDVRKAKPLISPLTLRRPRFPHTLAASNGRYATTHPNPERRCSRGAEYVLTMGFFLSLGGFAIGLPEWRNFNMELALMRRDPGQRPWTALHLSTSWRLQSYTLGIQK